VPQVLDIDLPFVLPNFVSFIITLVSNPVSMEFTSPEKKDVSDLKLLNHIQREQLLRVLCGKIVREVGVKMKSVKPFHERVKSYCVDIENNSLDDLRGSTHGILVFIRIICEYFGNAVKRSLKFAREHLQAYDDSKCEQIYQDGIRHLDYLNGGGSSIFEGEKDLTAIFSYLKRKVEIEDFSVFGGDKSAIRDMYITRAKNCAWASLIETLEEGKTLRVLQIDFQNLRESNSIKFIRDTSCLFQRIEESKRKSVECLRSIMDQAEREGKKLESGQELDVNTLEKWPCELTEHLNKINERKILIDEIREKISSYTEKLQKEDDSPSCIQE
jgi:hypothetical protein